MEAERLFELFRRTREPARLGAVFDLVADDLFAVALHLTRDDAEAEDLVQATFLAALRRAARWDPSRPLRPWLLGLLQREAKQQRRRRRRVPDPGRLPARPAPPTPVESALAAETADAVRAAVATLPQPYKQVVELRLLHALAPDAIAQQLRRSPGAVRTQLWRGLELLRRALPKGVALGVPLVLAPATARAAVRAQVVAAAGAARAGALGFGVITGVLLMKKVLLTISAAAACAAGLAWLATRTPEAVAQHARVLPPAAERVRGARAAQPSADEREAAAARTPLPVPAEATPPPPETRTPYDVRLLVVDVRGDPVAGAEVLLHEPEYETRRGKRVVGASHAAGPPFLTVTTDMTGRCVVRLDGEACFVRAEKAQVGRSWDRLLRAGTPELREELRLQLAQAVHVRGVVLGADRTPVAGATLHARLNGAIDQVAAPPPVETDADGRFALALMPRGFYWLSAQHDGRRSETIELDWTKGPTEERDVVLRFPGTYTVRGVLLGGHGQPVAGRIFGVPSGGGYDKGLFAAQSGNDGRFELRMTDGGTYDVVGGVEGSTAARVRIVLDDARPHQEVTLRLQPFAVVAGRIVDEHGAPRAGVHVGFSYASERTLLRDQISSLHGVLARGPTAHDGSFRFSLPAGHRYLLVCQPIPGNSELFVPKQEVQPPANGIVVVLRDADAEGFRITGRALDEATGAPVTKFPVSLVEHAAPGAYGMHVVARVDRPDGRFEVGPLPPDKRYSLLIEAAGLASAHVGPFDATVRTENVRVMLVRPGALRCIVRRADGKPAAGVLVWLRAPLDRPVQRRHDDVTDADGVAHFAVIDPGRYDVYAQPAYAEQQRVQAHVQPGGEAQVEITLPP